jgi:hypothetical protein
MATTVTIENYRNNPVAHPKMAVVQPLQSRTRELKQVNADDYSGSYDRLAAFGVAVNEDGTYRPGVQVITATATVANDTHIVIADIDAEGNQTATLPAVATVGDGHTMVVSLRTKEGDGDLVVTGNSSEQVLGEDDVTLEAEGDVLRLVVSGGAWVAQ